MTRMKESDTDDSAGSNRRRFLKAIGALGVVGLAGCGGDGDGETSTPTATTEDGGDGTDTAMETSTPTATATPTPQPPEIPDPANALLSFGEESRQASAGEAVTIEGTVTNNYLFTVMDVEVSLAGPTDDWGISTEDETMVGTLESRDSADITWEVTVPDSADGDAELTATVSYATEVDDASVDVSTVVSVIPPAPEVTAPITDGLAGQMDASKLSETDSLGLWQAVDADGRSGVLTQSDGEAQPSVVTDGSPTGESVARFEGGSDFMTTSGPLTDATSGVTMIAGFRLGDETLPRQVLMFNGSDSSGTGYGVIINSETREAPYEGHIDLLYGGVNWWYSQTTIQDDAFHVVTLIIPGDSPGSPQLFIDGTEITSEFDTQFESQPPAEPSGQYGIGQDQVTVDVNPYIDGDIGEELVYERALSQEEREQVESYLTDKWAGSGSGE